MSNKLKIMLPKIEKEDFEKIQSEIFSLSAVIDKTAKNNDYTIEQRESFSKKLIEDCLKIVNEIISKKYEDFEELEEQDLWFIKNIKGQKIISEKNKKKYHFTEIPDENNSYYLNSYINSRINKASEEGVNPNLKKQLTQLMEKNKIEVRDICSEINVSDSIGNFFISGLVIGSIQSGKTESFNMLLSHAFDLGYERVMILSGMLEDLRSQTNERISDSLTEEKYSEIYKKDLFPDVKNILENGDFKEDDKTSYFSKENEGNKIYFITKKNVKILKNIYNYYSDEVVKDKLLDKKTLIIDDEGDLASVNTNGYDKEKTKTNDLILKIIGLFNKVSYISYTATPQSLLLQEKPKEDSEERSTLFPKDFIKVINPGRNYFGIEELLNCEDDIVKIYSKSQQNILRDFISGNNVMSPNSEVELIDNFILDFINSYIKCREDISNINEYTRSNLYTSLINAATKKDDFHRIQKYINNFILEAKENIDWFKRKMRYFLLLNNEDIIDIGLTNNDLLKVLSQINVVIKFSDEKKQIKNESNSGKNDWISEYNLKIKDSLEDILLIVIGGHKVSRGMTFPNLLTILLDRKTKQWDSVTQMSRWFGYRNKTSKYMSLYIDNDFWELYKSNYSLHSDLCQTIKVNTKNIDEFTDHVIKTFGPMMPTSRNKMHYTKVMFSDKKITRSSADSILLGEKVFSKNSEIINEQFKKIELKRKNKYLESEIITKDKANEIIDKLEIPNEQRTKLLNLIKDSDEKSDWKVIFPIRTSLESENSFFVLETENELFKIYNYTRQVINFYKLNGRNNFKNKLVKTKPYLTKQLIEPVKNDFKLSKKRICNFIFLSPISIKDGNETLKDGNGWMTGIIKINKDIIENPYNEQIKAYTNK